MMTHAPVLLSEAINALAIKADGVYIDGTFGRGGHSQAILNELSHGHLIVIDKDPEAITAAKSLFGQDPRVHVHHSSYANLKEIAKKEQVVGEVDGILLDLGVSSPQLDDSNRGFSFMNDGPLDMRMDPTQGQTAQDYIENVDEGTLAQVLRDYGEERFAKRIAHAIKEAITVTPLTTTKALANLVERTIPRDKHKHAATRTFQALRIAVNHEFEDLHAALDAALECLKPGGRLCCISFHSLEDRIVKQFMRKHSQAEQPPKGMPLTIDQIKDTRRLNLIGKSCRASEAELNQNVRARSATLRIAEKRL